MMMMMMMVSLGYTCDDDDDDDGKLGLHRRVEGVQAWLYAFDPTARLGVLLMYC
jgi:hypothetical protein